MKNSLDKTVAWWKEATTQQETDSRRRAVYRKFLQVGGIVLLFIISPVLVLAIVFLAFITV